MSDIFNKYVDWHYLTRVYMSLYPPWVCLYVSYFNHEIIYLNKFQQFLCTLNISNKYVDWRYLTRAHVFLYSPWVCLCTSYFCREIIYFNKFSRSLRTFNVISWINVRVDIVELALVCLSRSSNQKCEFWRRIMRKNTQYTDEPI